MNTPTISMPVEVARQKLRAYRARQHKDADEIYRRCEQAYAELAKGTPLIDVQEAIRQVETDHKSRPKLAIARADRKEVEFYWRSGSQLASFDTRLNNADNPELHIHIDMGRTCKHDAYHTRGYAMVPMVPADVRPAAGQLRDWFILWEVDEWHDRRQLTPPRDPYLLKHIGGTLYAVLAEWDLTEIERSIMQNI